MSIRLRLAAVFTLATIALVVVGGYVYLGQLRAGLESSLDQGLQARAATIAAAVASDPSTQLPDGTDGYAQIFASDGTVLGGSRVLRGDRLLTAAQVLLAAGTGPVHVNRSVYLHTAGDAGPESMRIYGAQPAGSRVVIAVADKRDLIDDAMQRSTRQLVIFGAIVILLAAPGSWLLARGALRPVDRMRAQVARLEADDAAEGVPIPRTRDEIARLGRTFNGLLDRLHAALERERAFVADAGHELRSPLTVLKGEFELAQRPGRTRQDLVQTVGVAAEETDRLIRLSENLLLLARENEPIRNSPFDLTELVGYAITAVAATADAHGVRITVRDGIGAVTGDADRMRQAIDNLLTNAIRYSAPGGTVTIRLAHDHQDAVVEVADDGPGFPPEFLPRAFERFARADDARARETGGSGLGLAIVAAIMRTHGGTATAANLPGGGAVLTLRWPQPVDGTAPGVRAAREAAVRAAGVDADRSG